MTLPTKTPSADTAASARLAPINTAHGCFESAAIVIAASCVLSPISARKMIPNVVSNTRRSIRLLQTSLQISHEDGVTNQRSASARQLLPIMRPCKPGHQQIFEISHLFRLTTIDRLAPDVRHIARRD